MRDMAFYVGYGDGKYLDYIKNLLSDFGGQIFWFLWVECNISHHHRPK